MQTSELCHLSEDDIRVKVVYGWLKDCGLSDKDIVIEYSINLRLGRGIKTVNSRTDVLVKNTEGLNLLIIEVKRPSHSLNTADKQQALSYARALADGGIAPFTILTNGDDTLIFDSVTGAEVIGHIQYDHQYVKNGFRVSSDGLEAKAEALEYLITLSPENLIIFCKAQVERKMQILKSENLFSGKKYIPQLYVDRKRAKDELNSKLFNEKAKQVVLVIGPPQHGKTCFLCHTVESYLEKGIPCLFYPAVSLRKGLLQEIQDDFEWEFQDQFSPSQLANKLRKIIERTGQKIILFVDGWNEMLSQALTINDECQRLNQNSIQLVMSTTSPSLSRLLQDEAANLTYIATESNLSTAIIRKLTTKPLKNTTDLSIVQISPFEYEEIIQGKKLHELAYNTVFANNSNLPKDPFYLRLAAESYSNDKVPAFATRTELIRNGLIKKALRRGIQEVTLFTNLNEIANVIIEKDAPFSCVDLPTNLRADNSLSCWIESAILIHLFEKEIPEIDFYYTHDKDFAIAILNRKWQDKLNLKEKTVEEELKFITRTEAGQSALRWFLSCPEHCSTLEKIFASATMIGIIDNTIAKVLTDSILNQVELNNNLSFDWLETYINQILLTQVDQEKFSTDLAALIYSFLMSINGEGEKTKYEFWMRLLVKYDKSMEELSIDESLISKYYGDDIKNFFEEQNNTSLDVDLFEKLVFDKDVEIASNAALILAHAYPIFLLKKIPNFHKYYTQNNMGDFNKIIKSPCEHILYELGEMYYGSMCPGWLSNAMKGDQDIVDEFYKQKSLWWPILKIIDSGSQLYLGIVDMLEGLSEYLDEDKNENSLFPNSNQLPLDF